MVSCNTYKISASSTLAYADFENNILNVKLYNAGANTAYFMFDGMVTTSNGFPILSSDEIGPIGCYNVTTCRFICDTAETATIYVIAVNQ